MGIKFTDPRLYVKGIGEAYMRDPTTGNITYYSDKFQEGQINPTYDDGEISAGLGSALATMIPTNSRVSVNFTAADFDLYAKAASVGATLGYGAPVLVCQTVTAASAALAIDVTQGPPVANVGRSNTICYVQQVGAGSPLAQGGVAYSINAATGAVSGFNATAGTQYKVWYYISRANAQMATISSNMNGKVQHFTAAFAVYSNVNTRTLEGTRWGTLYVVVPSLKLSAGGSTIDGNQTGNTTTGIIGQALMYDEETISASCDECANAGSPMAYYIVVPCDNTSGLQGLALVGGVLTVQTGTTHTINEFRLVSANGSLIVPDPALMSYTLSGAPEGTSVTGSVLAAGATAGDGEITGTWSSGGESFSAVANLSIVSA